MIKKRIATKKEKGEIVRKISDILQKKEGVLFAYIFGSFISGESFRDVDVGVFIAGGFTKLSLQMELALENELQDALHIPIDVRILNTAPISFAYNIVKSGMVVVDNDKFVRADFEGLLYNRYFDLQHLLREYLREITNAPV